MHGFIFDDFEVNLDTCRAALKKYVAYKPGHMVQTTSCRKRTSVNVWYIPGENGIIQPLTYGPGTPEIWKDVLPAVEP